MNKSSTISFRMNSSEEFSLFLESLNNQLALAKFTSPNRYVAVDFADYQLKATELSEFITVVNNQEFILIKAQNNLQKRRKVITHEGSVRSGQEIRADGTIMILGDVNRGAVITAFGNVIVSGVIRGRIRVLDENSRISASRFDYAQIQIHDSDLSIVNTKNKADIYLDENHQIELKEEI